MDNFLEERIEQNYNLWIGGFLSGIVVMFLAWLYVEVVNIIL